MPPARFARDNTEGYTPAELTMLNAAWHRMAVSTMDETSDDKSLMDHVAEELLFHFDQGARGDALILAVRAAGWRTREV